MTVHCLCLGITRCLKILKNLDAPIFAFVQKELHIHLSIEPGSLRPIISEIINQLLERVPLSINKYRHFFISSLLEFSFQILEFVMKLGPLNRAQNSLTDHDLVRSPNIQFNGFFFYLFSLNFQLFLIFLSFCHLLIYNFEFFSQLFLIGPIFFLKFLGILKALGNF